MNTKRVRPVVATCASILLLSVAAHAQLLQPEVLFMFAKTNGAGPSALTLGSDGNFYGTTAYGGNDNYGTVFRVTTNGTLTTLVSFADTNGAPSPYAELTLGSDGSFYGTTYQGGSSNYGTVFRVTTNGTLTTLVTFANTNGANPVAALSLGSDGSLYGTTRYGGSADYGTVFHVKTDGILTTLGSFFRTNGAYPFAALTLGSDGSFYGTTHEGGSANYGTVFRITTNGALTTLVSFDWFTTGRYPVTALTLGSDGNFYGTTTWSSITNYSPSRYGDVFRMTTNGILTTLVSMNFGNGANLYANLTPGGDGNFYSTAFWGGGGEDGGYGTVYRVTTNGTVTALVKFAKTNGWGPGTLTLGNDGNFYGTTVQGGYKDSGLGVGSSGFGVIYRLRRGAYFGSFGMVTNGFELNALNIGGSGTVVLESSPELEFWTPIQTNGDIPLRFLDTTALDQPQQFYRLKQQ